MSKESLIEFPTSFPVKVLGKDEPEFHKAVLELIAERAEFHPEDDVKVQASGKGKYVSITVTLLAESQEQLDNVYQSLHDHELVMMVF